MKDLAGINRRFMALRDSLDERSRRLTAAAESIAIGRGGITAVAEATGMSRPAIRLGLTELREPAAHPPNRIRRPGGGRKKTVIQDPSLLRDLERLIEPVTRGDPESPLRWTCKSLRKLAAELGNMGHNTSHRMVADLLHNLGYSLQANSKTREGSSHPDRNAQFEYLNRKVKRQLRNQQPAISVDTKKKELVGDFKNNGRELRPAGNPTELLITADSGGSNGSSVRLWKLELQKLADETGLNIKVCHLPPGTSKWNKIEPRLFSFISQNWRGKPLISHEVIVNLIAATTTTAGLLVHSEIDAKAYPAGVKVSDKELSEINIHRDKFHGDWNYCIKPRHN